MKPETRDLFAFILIMAALFLVWVTTGGPQRNISQGGMFLKPIPPVDSGETYNKWPGGANGSNQAGYENDVDTSFNEESEPVTESEIQAQIEEIKEKLNELKEDAKYSSFKDQVYIKNYGNEAEEEDPNLEYIKIKADRKNSQGIPITNWSLKSTKSNKTVKIGKGAQIPKFGNVSQEKTITLKAGEEAYLITGSSPIGVSFKLNKCTGYFEQFQDFNPTLSKDCPSPKDEMLSFEDKNNLTSYDVDYIKSLSRCINPLSTPTNLSNTAREFLSENINYSSCVEKYQNDEDFFEDEWMIYLGKNSELWKGPFEVIQLLDEDDKLVDDYSFSE